eukprot:TRINITY_DN16047_c0_g1_i1.p1 TRINITY_DN16047_c0_g1~~TRINITY_DN16047_c0_g1_i1.p1  ORF type:complete len:1159 (-),score=306.52 TRINITY_DN16047_c0_g1_i1:32-3064(-)
MIDFDPLTCRLIEAEFKKGEKEFVLKDPNYLENNISYTLNFVTMKQIEKISSLEVDIARREPNTHQTPSTTKKNEIVNQLTVLNNRDIIKESFNNLSSTNKIQLYFSRKIDRDIKLPDYSISFDRHYGHCYFGVLVCTQNIEKGPMEEHIKRIFQFSSQIDKLKDKLHVTPDVKSKIMSLVNSYTNPIFFKGPVLLLHIFKANNLTVPLRAEQDLAPYVRVVVNKSILQSKVPSKRPTWCCSVQNKWRPYPEEINKLIEEEHEKGASSVVIKLNQVEYTLNLLTMKQINNQTNYTRDITREVDPNYKKSSPPLGPNPVWDDYFFINMEQVPERSDVVFKLSNYTKLNQSIMERSFSLNEIIKMQDSHSLPFYHTLEHKQHTMEIGLFYYKRNQLNGVVENYVDQMDKKRVFQLLLSLYLNTEDDWLMKRFAAVFEISTHQQDLYTLEYLVHPYHPEMQNSQAIILLLKKIEKYKDLTSSEMADFSSAKEILKNQIKFYLENYSYYIEHIGSPSDTQHFLNCFEYFYENDSKDVIHSYFKTAAERAWVELEQPISEGRILQKTIQLLSSVQHYIRTMDLACKHFAFFVDPSDAVFLQFNSHIHHLLTLCDAGKDSNEELLEIGILYQQILSYMKFKITPEWSGKLIDDSPLIYKWIENWIMWSTDNLRISVTSHVHMDQWVAMNDNVCFSNAVITLSEELNKQIDTLFRFKIESYDLLKQYVQLVLEELVRYSEQLCEKAKKTLKHGREANDKKDCTHLNLSKEFCVQLSNMSAVQYMASHIQDKIKDLLEEETFNSLFESLNITTFNKLATNFTSVSSEIALFIKKDMDNILHIDKDKEDKFLPFFEYLNNQLVVLKPNLDVTVFKEILKVMLLAVNQKVTTMLKDGTKNSYFKQKLSSQEVVEILNEFVKDITDWFHANGTGLSTTFIEKTLSDLNSYLFFWSAPTSQIISTYQSGDTKEISCKTMKAILKSRKEDQEAKDFLKTIKKNPLPKEQKPPKKLFGLFIKKI